MTSKQHPMPADELNLVRLSSNTYSGRGIVAGLSQTGEHMVQVYWVMGRSDNSRNRVFKVGNSGRLYTAPADPSKVKDPSLIIYNAMLESGPHFIVSNGSQTDTVAEASAPLYLNAALAGVKYEPDEPHFTPRITAVCSLTLPGPLVQMSILRRSSFDHACDRFLYEYVPWAGYGHLITTYAGDGHPLPPFAGEPRLVPLRGSMEEVADTYWRALNQENRVALAVKFIEIGNGRSDVHMINRFQEVR